MRVAVPACVSLLLCLAACESPTPPPEPLPIEWIPVEGGSFEMGSEDGDEDELPVHEVEVPDFELLRAEVTVAQYRECIDDGGCDTPAHGWDSLATDDDDQEDMPVTHLSVDHARAFCEWLDRARLPTEAEWEFAARSGGLDRRYPWGDEEPTADHAVFRWAPGLFTPIGAWRVCDHPAGDTDQGVCDMAGSVWEFVEDCYHGGYEALDDHEDPIAAPDDGDAWTEDCLQGGVARGGSWGSAAEDELRCANRVPVEYPGDWFSDVGFRCAR